jgi:gamma-glutamyltranspeptidase/glutathione hydrolase
MTIRERKLGAATRDAYGDALEALGHDVETYEDIFTGTHEIGAATGIEFGPGRRLTVAAEPDRRGGGSATVVHPRK